jgi:outer membrane protein assembly factor BamB
LYCLDAATGKLRWEFWTDGWAAKTPAVADGRVYSIIDKKVYCLSAAAGKKIWETEACASNFPPAAGEGLVVIGGRGEVFCLNAQSGSILWKLNLGSWRFLPIIDKGKVYIISRDSSVYCVDAKTGTIIRDYKIGSFMLTKPVVTGGNLYVGADKIYCFDAASGILKWDAPSGGTVVALQAVSGRLYLLTDDAMLYCCDTNTGSKSWQLKIPKGGTSFTVQDETVLLSTASAKVYCFKFPDKK